jgi:hypothetical protein
MAFAEKRANQVQLLEVGERADKVIQVIIWRIKI